MYNTHRGMVPAPNSRLTELLDQLRQEFESQSRSTGEFEHQCMSASSPPPYPSPSSVPRIVNVEPSPTVQVSPVYQWLWLIVANFAETFSN